jgi:cytochrome c peroxidase
VAKLDEAILVMGREMLKIELLKREVADTEAFMHAPSGYIPQFPVPSLP